VTAFTRQDPGGFLFFCVLRLVRWGTVSKPDSCLINTGQYGFVDILQLIDFQYIQKVGIALEYYLAYQGRLVEYKTIKKVDSFKK
jgi:hypothetical protein